MKLRARNTALAAVFSCLLIAPRAGFSAGEVRYTLTGGDPQTLKDLVVRLGGKSIRQLRYHSGWVLSLDKSARRKLKVEIEALRLPYLLEEDGVVSAADDSPERAEDIAAEQKIPWGIQAVSALRAHSIARGHGVTVCVADSGVQGDHPDLADNVIGGENTMIDARFRPGNWDDGTGHGTHVAGTIAALDNGKGVIGVAPEAKIFAARVLNSFGNGTYSSLAEGIRSCVAHGARVINMSLRYRKDSPLVRRALHDAAEAGVILVAAAGNTRGPLGYPAIYPKVIAVSAVNQKLQMASFGASGPEVSFAAPGVNVLSTTNFSRYSYKAGTSMSSPHVAGVAALMLSAGRKEFGADDIGFPKEQQGRGFINALKSVEGDAPSFTRASDLSDYTLTGTNSGELHELALQSGAQIVRKLKYHAGWVIRLDEATAAKFERSIFSGERRANSMRLEKDVPVFLPDDPPADLGGEVSTLDQVLPWGLKAVHAREAHQTSRGSDVRVCVIDTGVQKRHPDLRGNIVGGENTIYSDDASWADDNGHGTHVAGTIAALDNDFGVTGVAPEAKIFAVKALSAAGMGGGSSLAEGIRACIANHAQVINMSLRYEEDSRIVRNAVKDAIAAGIVLVAAAGNTGGPVGYPARYSGVVAVSALSPDMKFALFSSFGPEIAFAAPGVNVLSTALGSAYGIRSGTSMAAPHVSGVAALFISAKRGTLRARDIGLPQKWQGAGCIDAAASLEEDTVPPPVFTFTP